MNRGISTVSRKYRCVKKFANWTVFVVLLVSCRLTWAHHEAVLGPQSAAVTEGSGYWSFQGFTKKTASAEAPQETAMLLSGGVTPFAGIPIAFNVTLPVSIASGKQARVGLENLFVSTRLRLDLKALQRYLGKDGNYVLFLAGVELPTGSMDQPFGKAPTNTLWGMMSSMERGQCAALGFVLTRLEGTNGEGLRKGHELLVGAGVAYTPVETSQRMVSVQFGTSYEVGLANRVSSEVIHSGGYQRVMLTPAMVVGLNPQVQLLGYGAVPILQYAPLDTDRMRWRLGAGVAYCFE